MNILVTGAAGFIGYHLCKTLLENNHFVVGIDNLNNYYDVTLKEDRLKNLGIQASDELFNQSYKYSNKFVFSKIDISDETKLEVIFEKFEFDAICNLAAQAGVRYSLSNPKVYIKSNVDGFVNILEFARNYKIKKIVYASSSSVYGNSTDVPFNVNQSVDMPVSLYAATKKSNELMAYTYSHLYDIQMIGLRFFTVYGPYGRPDMAFFSFTRNILNNMPIHVFNNGNLSRDFTYIDDIVNGILLCITKNNSRSNYLLYNIGNNSPIKLIDFIKEIEKQVGKEAIKIMMPMQPGDVLTTWADIDDFINDYGYTPSWSIDKGIESFVRWFKDYYSFN